MMTGASSPLKLTSHASSESGPHRVSSRSLSWNSSGSFLALAGSDRMARIFSVESSSGTAREVLVISHAAAVTKVRFHPSTGTQLVTAAADKVVRLWDVRGATQRSQGKIDLVSGSAPVTVEWCPTKSHLLSVTETDGIISIYDARLLNATTASSTTNTNTTTTAKGRRPSALYSFSTRDDLPESCVFSPDGEYLVVDSMAEGVGKVRIWKYHERAHSEESAVTGETASSLISEQPVISYPSHAPLYAMQFSPNGAYLATGGADATVGIWDSNSMCCRHVVDRHSKFIRSVAFSPDSKILASASEEMIDLADATNGSMIGQVSSGQRTSRTMGAEEIAFHPKESFLLACARSDLASMAPTPLSVIKLSISSASQ